MHVKVSKEQKLSRHCSSNVKCENMLLLCHQRKQNANRRTKRVQNHYWFE